MAKELVGLEGSQTKELINFQVYGKAIRGNTQNVDAMKQAVMAMTSFEING